jgi:hypothetical protein
MANFTPVSAAIGGALIGLSAVLLMLLNFFQGYPGQRQSVATAHGLRGER